MSRWLADADPKRSPVIVRINGDGKLEELALDNVRFAKAEVPNAPNPGRGRTESITDLAYVDGRRLPRGPVQRGILVPTDRDPVPVQLKGSTARDDRDLPRRSWPVRDEVADPDVRQLPIQNEPYLLAAYTCTPLVKVPVADLKAGAHVKGTTIAELGIATVRSTWSSIRRMARTTS